MKCFKDLGIKKEYKNLVGDKIKMERIINREIIVETFKVDESKYEGKDKCLAIQFELDGERRVVFTGSKNLLAAITEVKKEDFPFKTTIVKTNGYYEFM